MESDGPNVRNALTALGLVGSERTDTRRNATNIVRAIIAAYSGNSSSKINPAKTPPKPVTGLVYGRIQSGKTRAMIASTAMAFDNKFRIAVVMTSNINDLVAQTHLDFSRGLPGMMIFTKDNDLGIEIDNTTLHLEHNDGRLLLVCSKGNKSLKNISNFLAAIGAENYPVVIFDDEGDQASLDTNTRKRSRGVKVGPSPINNTIQNKLRVAVPKHVYVSVTGTPQAVLLQSADSSHKPSFIVMLPPGPSYVGGDSFFFADEPEGNRSLVSIVDANEQRQLLNTSQPIPTGLRRSILFFLVSAAAAIKNLGVGESGYSFH